MNKMQIKSTLQKHEHKHTSYIPTHTPKTTRKQNKWINNLNVDKYDYWYIFIASMAGM